MEINNLVLSDQAQGLLENGTWVRDIPGAPGVGFFVLGWGSEPVQKELEKEQRQAREDNKGEPLTAEQYASCTRNVLSNVVLKDWEGLTDNGKELKYSKKLATEFLTSKNGERLANAVLSASQRLSARVNDFVKVAVKN